MATKNTTRKYWNVWIEGRRNANYSRGRETIEASCGSSSGSGSGFGGWDVSYHSKTQKNARKIASKAASLTITRSVRVYQDDGPDEYIKGSK